jgi:DNA-binding CsgD family transcriptional regulator
MQMPVDGGYGFIHGLPQKQVELYMSRYHREDVLAQTAFAKGLIFEGNVILDRDVMPHEEIIATNYHREYLARESMEYSMTAVIFGPNSSGGVGSWVCAFWRRIGEAPYGEPDRERMKLLLPHVSRSLGVMQRIRQAELTATTTLTALDRLPNGVLLVDARGDVVFVNHTAQLMLEAADGLSLRKLAESDSLGRLTATDRRLDKNVTDAINATVKRNPFKTAHFSQSVVVPQSSGLSNYVMQFSALGNHHEYSTGRNTPAAIIFITDSGRNVEVDPALLQKAYGLTATEARVAIAMLKFATLDEVAQHMRIGVGTVRTHVKRIYAKLDVDTRARFTKLMVGLASPVAH